MLKNNNNNKSDSFGDNLKNLPNIDDEILNEEDDESESEYGERMSKLVCNLDMYGDDIAESTIKDQDILEAQQVERERTLKKQNDTLNYDSSSDENDGTPITKSHFFLSTKQEIEPHSTSPNDQQQDYFFTRLYDNERVIDSLSNISCLYSSNILASEALKDVSSDSIKVKGKLMLTPFQLLFIPYVNQINSRLAQLDDEILSLFTNRVHPYSFVIPLTCIYEIRSITQSDKYRRVETFFNGNSLIKDLLIKCKNFMTKLLIFPSPNKNLERINRFVKNLINSASSVRNERFQHLISSVVSNLNESANESNKNDLRKSYLTASDLNQDLIDCQCYEFMQIKLSSNGTVNPSRGFEIKTSLPFFAAPKNTVGLILTKRIVVNETNVNEFNQTNETTNLNSLVVARKSSKVSELFSPRAKNSSSSSLAINQQPIIADLPYSNPFYENNFPLWAFTDSSTGCSLVIVPENVQSNRQEECEIIIKNYNALLCDEIMKLKKKKSNNIIQIQANQYGEYEYYKFKVPFDWRKISSSYFKLMDMCSFKTSEDYHKEYESNSFYQRLHNSKWLKKVSNLLQLTSKIVNCLHVEQHNVFLEEFKGNMDCSCILTSLVKMCLNKKYRNIIGFENLIQKDWFLTGHPFSKRFESNLNISDEYLFSNDSDRMKTSYSTTAIDVKEQNHSNKSIGPTFLLFLDCVFQLTLQYPKEFEFNEIYLIHLWDYSLSSMSFTFSFDGVLAWLEFQENKKFLLPTDTQIDSVSKEIFSKKIFNANNSFWLTHLETNNKLLKNANYEPEALILIPNDKFYVLKFWSRNYLRWHEKYHSYNTHELTSNQRVKIKEPVISPSLRPHRPPPPPPSTTQSTQLSLVSSNSNPNIVPLTILAANAPHITYSSSGLKITTRITEDGDMQSSF